MKCIKKNIMIFLFAMGMQQSVQAGLGMPEWSSNNIMAAAVCYVTAEVVYRRICKIYRTIEFQANRDRTSKWLTQAIEEIVHAIVKTLDLATKEDVKKKIDKLTTKIELIAMQQKACMTEQQVKDLIMLAFSNYMQAMKQY